MAEEAEDIIGEDGADAPEDGGSKRKKLILFIVLPLLLLIGVGVARHVPTEQGQNAQGEAVVDFRKHRVRDLAELQAEEPAARP